MKGKEIAKEVMKERGYTMKVLAEKLGYETTSGISERFRNTQDMRVDVLARFMEAMDCEVIIRSKLRDRKEWKVTAE